MGIQFVTQFALDEPVETPLRMRQKVDSNLDHARAVSVVEVVDGSQRKVNGFQLTSSKNPRPKESTDDIAQAIADIMQWRSVQAMASGRIEAVAAGLNFIVKVHRFSGQRMATFKWTWRADLSGSDEDELDPLEDPEVLEGSHPYLKGVIEMQSDLVDRLIAAKERSDGRLIMMTEHQQKPLEMVGQQLHFANTVLMQGMQAMVTALNTTWSHEEAKAAESAKTERWNSLITSAVEHFGPAVKVGAQQLMMYVGGKMTGQKTRVPRGGPDMGPEAPAQPVDRDAPTPDLEADVVSDPLFEMVAAFGESLRPAQRKMLRDHFEAASLDAFDELLESASGAEVRVRFETLQRSLGDDLGPLMSVVSELDEEQQQLAMHVIAAVHEHGSAEQS